MYDCSYVEVEESELLTLTELESIGDVFTQTIDAVVVGESCPDGQILVYESQHSCWSSTEDHTLVTLPDDVKIECFSFFGCNNLVERRVGR
jgi:hypothetical protein